MNVRHLLALATPLVLVSVGTPAYTYFAAAKTAKVEASSAAAAPGKPPYVLKAGNGPGGAVLNGMAMNLRTTSVKDVLAGKGDHRGKWGGDCGGAAKVPAGSKVFCFNAADTGTQEWYPQGVTSVSDAQPDETWGSAKPLMVGWYDRDKKAPHKSMRVTFVNTKSNAYKHVLLVWPYQDTRGRTTYEPIGTSGSDKGVHAGGIAWYGNRLYVADTGTGLRVFDMRQIFDLGKSENGATTHPGLVGLHGKTYYGHGYRYVMPQVLSYVPAKRTGASCTGNGTPSHSWLTINRTGDDKLVTGESCPNGNGRVAQFPLENGSNTGDLVSNGKGEVLPATVAKLPASYIQGGATSNGTWWFTRNVPPEERPYPPGENKNQGELVQARWSSDFEEVKRQTISYGPEDLSCWRGTDQIWTLAEHAGQRALYGMTRSEC
ncbi:hypothetical protein [Actinomadura sp. 9N407]|uniref:hypothetical protein n=1 Tax=Actinomadura sp. 9N407 TaxID=3375154 RepID=UPI003792DED2